MGKTTLLISDLHLHPGAPDITRGFLAWLEENRGTDVDLYLLGDIFDAWIGDDLMLLGDADPSGHARLACAVADQLKAASDRGTRIYLMHGNRDFLLGSDFAERAGATLLNDPQRIELGGEPTLLMHGDSLCTRDEAYMAFRVKARDPQWQASILAMPIPERLALASQLRQQSGEANSTKAADIMDVTPDEVLSAMQQHDVKRLIHGHTHRPDVHPLTLTAADGSKTQGQRMVIGDWSSNEGWEVRIDGDGAPALNRFTF
ncbi:UDP-2,3-diacylglucosamine diphosphatase [Halomonas sp. DP8Y7-3]|uniref:UDP-2,3-diacylglucosamine diphosphatase n=1 Tax=Halomonas sp. DP8Y7-3 TaxID=2859079 RepID=UPI001C965031|nr:UDP-2,3-diacylglucosamine diphosphatase [Halomonas sp. DP8Y7-3]MBY5927702.1 UDP-2,3-diacylglucosamine diphosphatase [Halomonas sp. DP8Y7-3]